MGVPGPGKHQNAARRELHRADALPAAIMLWLPHAGLSSAGSGLLDAYTEDLQQSNPEAALIAARPRGGEANGRGDGSGRQQQHRLSADGNDQQTARTRQQVSGEPSVSVVNGAAVTTAMAAQPSVRRLLLCSSLPALSLRHPRCWLRPSARAHPYRSRTWRRRTSAAMRTTWWMTPVGAAP